MKKLIILSIATLSAITNIFAQGEVLDKIIGVVDSKIILQSEVEEQFRLIEAQQGSAPPEARCIIADQLFVKSLLLAQAEKDSVLVGEEEIDQQIKSRVDYILTMMNGDVEQFEKYYGMSILEMKEKYRRDMEDQMLSERMQGMVVQGVAITPSEIRDFFNRIPTDSLPYFGAEVELAEIVIKPKVNQGELQKAYDRIVELRDRVVNGGESFGKIAEAHSDDKGSASQAGSLGWVKRGQMVPEFEAALFKLQNKEISPIIKTEFGYHFIQAVERRGNTVFARHILTKPEITFDDREQAKATLDSVRQLIQADSMTFTRAVKLFSENDETKNNAGIMVNPQAGTAVYPVGDLPTEVYFAIDEMEVGDISEPLEYYDARQELHYRLVTMLAYSEPHKASLEDDYSKIQAAALDQKKATYMSDWIDRKAVKSYITISDEYKQCSNMSKWFENAMKARSN